MTTKLVAAVQIVMKNEFVWIIIDNDLNLIAFVGYRNHEKTLQTRSD